MASYKKSSDSYYCWYKT